jgi:NitT/TauT family transport system ATP-binding protein
MIEQESSARGRLVVENVTKRYGDLLALDDISFTVEPGRFVSIVGPSGCGKSTLLEIVAALRTATAGRVLFDGEEVTRSSTDMGMVFQEESTLPWRTVLANVAFPLQIAGMGKEERTQRSLETLHLVGLSDFKDAYPYQLSGGMRQRVSIARMLVTRPRLLLMDEPFGALDEQTRLALGLELLRVVGETGASVLFITHSIQEAILLSDTVLVMSGRPGTIAMYEEVPLDRPRQLDDLGIESVARLTKEIWLSLETEVNRALESM